MSNDFVTVQVSVDNVGITRQGYGMPLVVSHNADFPERVRFYASSLEVADDFETDSPEYRTAQAFFAQSPKPPLIAIGRADGAVPTLQYTIEADAAENARTYEIAVKGEGFDDATASFTADADATTTEIHVGLLGELNDVTDKTFTAAYTALVNPDDTFTAAGDDICTAAAHGLLTGDGPFRLTTSAADLPLNLLTGTDYWIIYLSSSTFSLATTLENALNGVAVDIGDAGTGTHTISDTADTKRPSSPITVTGSAPGNWFSLALGVSDVKNGRLSIATTHASPSGLTDELDEILLEDSSWYQVHLLYPSSALVLVVATWAEANERTLVFASSDTDIVNVAVGSGTDIGALALAEEYTATSGMYYPDPSKFAAARWMGRWLPTDPGQATAALKTLAGLPVVPLTTTQKTNLKNRRMQTYIGQYGRGVMSEGMVFSTVFRFLDVRRDVDWLTDELRRMIFGLLAGSDKIPFTPAGIAKIEGGVRGSVELAVDRGVLAEGTTNVVAPNIEDIEDADKADRNLRGVEFFGTLQGAVHTVIPVRGSVTF